MRSEAQSGVMSMSKLSDLGIKKSVFICQKLFFLISHRSVLPPSPPCCCAPHIPPYPTLFAVAGGGPILKREKRRLEIECVPRFLPLAIPQARSLRKEENLFSIFLQPGLEPGSFTAFALLERYSRLPTEMEQNFNYL